MMLCCRGSSAFLRAAWGVARLPLFGAPGAAGCLEVPKCLFVTGITGNRTWQQNLATEPGNRTRHLPGFLTFVSSPACKTIAMSPYGSDSKQFPVFRTSELELATCINDEHLKLSCSGTGNGCHVSPWYSFQRISGPLPPLQVLVPY